MKKWITFIVLLGIGGLATPIMAQPKWVNQSFGLKNFDQIHEDANAVVLYDVAEIEINEDKSAEIKLRVAYKILTDRGTHYATISLPTSNTIEVSKIKGWHKKPKSKIKKLDDDMIIEAGFQRSAAYFDESRQYIASFPNPEPGDYVAFEATIEENDWTGCYQSFVFHRQQPVIFSMYSVTIPEDWKVSTAKWNMEDVNEVKSENQYSWTYQNLPFRESEPNKPSWNYLSKRISVVAYNPQEQSPTQFNSWENVANWCANEYENRADVSTEISKIVKTLLKDVTTDDEKLRLIADYVQENIRYVAIEIGKGRWQSRRASATFYNGYGDCKDKSTLMRAMLKSADIKSVPVLINATNRVDRRLPTPFQFNHVILAIPVKGLNLSSSFDNAIVNGWLFFDPTDPEVQIGEIPHNLQGRFVVMGSHLDSISNVLPYSDPESYSRTYRLDGSILPDGNYTADVVITSYNGWASEDRYYFKNNTPEEQKENLYRKLSQNIPSVNILEFRFEDFQDSLQIRYKLQGQEILYHTKQNKILHPDIFDQSLRLPLTAKERKYPIRFGGAKKIVKNISWGYPESWKIEVNSNKIKSECDGASITLICSCNNNKLVLNSVYQQTGHLMDVQLYSQAKLLSNALQKAQGKMIIFSK